jgi:hypothetical protein
MSLGQAGAANRDPWRGAGRGDWLGLAVEKRCKNAIKSVQYGDRSGWNLCYFLNTHCNSLVSGLACHDVGKSVLQMSRDSKTYFIRSATTCEYRDTPELPHAEPEGHNLRTKDLCKEPAQCPAHRGGRQIL